MSRTLKHKLDGKFKNGLIDIKNIPINLRLFWNRQNFWTGQYRHLKKELMSKEKEKEIKDFKTIDFID